jgi:hypothetical protein
MIAFPSLKTLGEVHHGLHGFPLEIKLVNAALRYHLTWKDLLSQREGSGGQIRTQFDSSLQDSGQQVG